MGLPIMPGPGDECTWPSRTNHPNDPRGPDLEEFDEYDVVDEFETDEPKEE